MEELKPLSQMFEPGERQRFFVMFNKADMTQRPLQLSDIHERAAAAELHSGVPEEIRSHFSTAQNLLAYSWFCYPFNVVAELHGYISVEYALRTRFPDAPKARFKALLQRAVAEGILRSEGFTYGRKSEQGPAPSQGEAIESQSEVKEYVEALAEAMRSLRNSLAHGSNMLHMKGGTALLVCSEVINQLFAAPSDA